MKFYPKQLNSLEELNKERIRLRNKKKDSDLGDLLPGKGAGSKKDEEKSSGNMTSGLVTAAMGLMSGGSPLNAILSLAAPAMGMLGKSKKPQKFLGKIAKNIIITYAIGKGVQFTIKGVRKYLQKRKEKQLIAEIEALSARRK